MTKKTNTKKPVLTGKKQTKDTKFKPGQSGNPKGRPPGTISLTTMIKQELDKCPDSDNKKTYADLIVKRILTKAIKDGDPQMIKTVWAYIDGLPKADITITDVKSKVDKTSKAYKEYIKWRTQQEKKLLKKK